MDPMWGRIRVWVVVVVLAVIWVAAIYYFFLDTNAAVGLPTATAWQIGCAPRLLSVKKVLSKSFQLQPFSLKHSQYLPRI